MVQEYLRPSDIRFTQDSIKQSFTDGTPLKKTFTDLARGRITLDDIECIACVFNGDYWVIHGNRRLYLYQVRYNIYRNHTLHRHCFIFCTIKTTVLGTNRLIITGSCSMAKF